MIKAIIYYRVRDKSSFTRKVIPYIYGFGQHYLKIITKVKWFNSRNVKINVDAKSLSQFVDATIGMLRFSPGNYLEDIKIKQYNYSVKQSDLFKKNKIIVGAILKPALANIRTHYKIIDLALKFGFDFIKDDDVAEFTPDRIRKIYKFCGKRIVYFHKVNNQKQFSGRPTMIIPWVDGWSLAELFGKGEKASLMIHCANTPSQISWKVHIILSRLAGANFIVVPDSKFDKTANLKEMIEAASRKIKNLPSARLIVAGAITLERIEEVKKSINRKFYRYLGFTIGSWLIRYLK